MAISPHCDAMHRRKRSKLQFQKRQTKTNIAMVTRHAKIACSEVKI